MEKPGHKYLVFLDYDYSNIYARNNSEFWATVWKWDDDAPSVFHTTDGGYNWESIKVWIGFPFYPLYVLEDSVIAISSDVSAVSYDGVSWKSTRYALQNSIGGGVAKIECMENSLTQAS